MNTMHQAAFLRGGISARYLATATAVPAVARRQAAPAMVGTMDYKCSINPHIPACRVETDGCPPPGPSTETHNSFCPTREFVC